MCACRHASPKFAQAPARTKLSRISAKVSKSDQEQFAMQHNTYCEELRGAASDTRKCRAMHGKQYMPASNRAAATRGECLGVELGEGVGISASPPVAAGQGAGLCGVEPGEPCCQPWPCCSHLVKL